MKQIPIFVPAFNDCSAGFGFAKNIFENNQTKVIDSMLDFKQLSLWKSQQKDTGLFMIGGGVPKNYIQDTVVCAEYMGFKTPLHKYAVQISVADQRDGALSGSTLKEACSRGKVNEELEQMVWCEATIAIPLMASYILN